VNQPLKGVGVLGWTYFRGVMTGMQRSNQSSLIKAQECGLVCGNGCCANGGLVEFQAGELRGVLGRRGCGLLCLVRERGREREGERGREREREGVGERELTVSCTAGRRGHI